MPCLIGHYSDEQAAQIALIENTSREALNPVAEAQAMQQLVKQFGYTHDELGAILGMTRSKVTHQLRLLKLDARLQAWLEAGALSEGHGKVLASVPIDQQYRLAYHSIQKDWSVRALEKAIHDRKAPKPSPPSARIGSPEMAGLARQLSDQLGYPVKLTLNKRQAGYVRIDFADLEHLQGILDKLGYKAD